MGGFAKNEICVATKVYTENFRIAEMNCRSADFDEKRLVDRVLALLLLALARIHNQVRSRSHLQFRYVAQKTRVASALMYVIMSLKIIIIYSLQQRKKRQNNCRTTLRD